MIHDSDYWAVYVKSASDVSFEDTTVVNALSFGIVTLSTVNMNINNVFVGGILPNPAPLLDNQVW